MPLGSFMGDILSEAAALLAGINAPPKPQQGRVKSCGIVIDELTVKL
jgi:hypothetical protein